MNFKIPLFDLNFDEKESEAVLETLNSKWLSTGPRTISFEAKFAELLGVNHAVALSNCTVALHLAMKLAGIKAGDEVICPSLTFVATCNAIRYVDAIPIFADVRSEEDPTIDPNDIERLITPKTKAIVVMHYGGFACDMDKIMEIARVKNLKVIEDACHAPLSEYRGRKLGCIGDVGCFSFFSNKNISTGEGGMIVTNNEDFFTRAKLLRSHGMTSLSYERAKGHSTSYDVVEFGYNYRMDDARASIGIVQLDKLENDLLRRAEVRNWYLEGLKGCNNILIPFHNYKEFSSNYIFPLVLLNSDSKRRDEIRGCLNEAGIQTSVHYPPVHHFTIYKSFYRDLPVTDRLADSLVTLPMYSKLNKEEVDYICSTLKKILNEE